MCLISYFKKKPAASSLKARLSPKKICATGLHDERPSSDIELVNYLLTTNATSDIIAHAIKKLEPYKRGLEIYAVVRKDAVHQEPTLQNSLRRKKVQFVVR